VALVALMAAQFMIVIDISGLNVALPSIDRSLHFSEASLQWVLSAYQIIFGGCLLLGGRIADLWGRKRMFLIGAALFSLTSLLCGLAASPLALVMCRGVQGLAAALLAPTALSTVTRMFAEGRDRNIALGVWGAVFGAGGAIGSLLSGWITTTWGWPWFFFINLPLGLFAFLAGPKLLPKDVPNATRPGFDIAGAVTVSAGVVVLLYALTESARIGWASGTLYVYIALAAVLLISFAAIQRKAASPLLPPAIIGQPTMRAGAVIGVFAGSYHFSLFFLLTLYMQNVLHLNAVQTSLGYLAAALPTIVFANLTARFIQRFRVKNVLLTGQLLVAASYLYYSRVPADGNYFIDLLPAMLVGGVGWGFLFPSINILSFSRLDKSVSGIAAGIINMSEQLGGALGVTLAAIVASVWSGRFAHLHPAAPSLSPETLTAGFAVSFRVLAGLVIVSFMFAALFAPSSRKREE
jgi:EmrB/QacA subfamily drug resistance transporter